jgi:hypothetical protein
MFLEIILLELLYCVKNGVWQLLLFKIILLKITTSSMKITNGLIKNGKEMKELLNKNKNSK